MGNNMILIDPKLLEQLENSTCFGIAWSSEAKECKRCDLQQECMAKTQSNTVFNQVKQLKPETEKAMKQAEEKKKEKTKEVTSTKKATTKKENKNPEGMPDLKGKSVEELWAILKERGGTCKEYENVAIQKMRLVMAIKKTYQ